jgi:EAL domain-containing protein (putative c-di-GMP-specific phosphodiesterase class I)
MTPANTPASRLAQEPHGVLLYSTSPVAFARLRAVQDLHGVNSIEPMINAALLTAGADVLAVVLAQWRDSLDSADAALTRGSFLTDSRPDSAAVGEALLHLTDLDTLLAQIQARWLPRLLASDAVFTMFQPLVSVSSRHTVAYECLMRARDKGLDIGAGKLISAARTMGLVHEVDKAAWRSAVRRGKDLAQDHLLFVNFTPSSISDLKFGLQEAMATCKEHGVPFDHLVFEVTEGEHVGDIKHLERMIASYRAEGAKVALDDLGSGYSGILHLADLLPDYVKLDQGLVQGAYSDYVRSVLLKGITEAAHNLGIQVVAEGVETEDDLKFCIAIDADLVQGYFLAHPAESPKPVSAESLQTLADWVRESEPTN